MIKIIVTSSSSKSSKFTSILYKIENHKKSSKNKFCTRLIFVLFPFLFLYLSLFLSVALPSFHVNFIE